MDKRIKKLFKEILINSLNTQQVNYLGERYYQNFNLYRESGFTQNIPIPRQTAAETLLFKIDDEGDIVKLFSILLAYEGKRFYNRDLVIWGRDDFIRLLKHNKWIFDRELKQFFLDPFYEHDINFLKSIQILDLRGEIDIPGIISSLSAVSSSMSIKDLEWRVTMRLFDLDRQTGELIRKIIDLLLSRQNLQAFTGELFFCFKELAINASKANYKIVFEKYMAPALGIDPKNNYSEFLERFREEIEDNGNARLLEMAKKDNRFYSITFQSSLDAIEIWVTNTTNISMIEKEQILKKIAPERLDNDSFFNEDDENKEGAGLGLNLIITVLQKYCNDTEPLKVVFYPDFIKIGFELKRSGLVENLPSEEKSEVKKEDKPEEKKAEIKKEDKKEKKK